MLQQTVFFFLFFSLGFFIRPFYKMMLGKQISLKDMESVVRSNFLKLTQLWATNFDVVKV